MNWVATEQRGDRTIVTWVPDWAEPTVAEFPNLVLDFSRIGIGFNLASQPTFAVVIGERRLDRKKGNIRLFYLLEEIEAPLAQRLLEGLINLKDKYRVAVAYGSKEPRQLADGVRKEEGLGFYREDYPQEIGRALWPSFVDWECTCGINLIEAPDEITLHRDIEALLNEDAREPDTGAPLISKGVVVPRLNLPRDFPIHKIRAAIQRADNGPCEALWYALMGLERSGWIRPEKEDRDERTGNQFTGY